MQLAILHRPLFPGTRPEETAGQGAPRVVDLEHESIWISYCPMALDDFEPHDLGLFNSHHRLATPVSPWEMLKIGGGTPPILTRHGWLIVYHGVREELSEPRCAERRLCYSAGVMVLSKEHPRVLLYRSDEPVLTPLLPQERRGAVSSGFERRLPHRHRPAPRSRLAGPHRRLLRDGRQSDRCGAPRRTRTPAVGGARRPTT